MDRIRNDEQGPLHPRDPRHDHHPAQQQLTGANAALYAALWSATIHMGEVLTEAMKRRLER